MLEIVQESKLSDVIIFRSSLAKSWISKTITLETTLA